MSEGNSKLLITIFNWDIMSFHSEGQMKENMAGVMLIDKQVEVGIIEQMLVAETFIKI